MDRKEVLESGLEIRVIDPSAEGRLRKVARKIFVLVRKDENVVDVSPALGRQLLAALLRRASR